MSTVLNEYMMMMMMMLLYYEKFGLKLTLLLDQTLVLD